MDDAADTDDHAAATTIAAKATATGTVDLAVGTELWAIWAYIAIEQAVLARAARPEWVARWKAGGSDWDPNIEMQPAMIALVAVATSLAGFEDVVKRTGVAATPTSKEPTAADWIWARLREGFDVSRYTNTWPAAIKNVFALRNSMAGGLLHPTTVFAPASQDHPAGVPGMAQARVVFTTETADKALALMREIYGVCRTSVRPEHPALKARIDPLGGMLKKLSIPDDAYFAWGSGSPDDLSKDP